MASGPHTFATMSVFSPTRFEGSRIALISLRGPVDMPPLGAPRRSRLAAEFGYDTCVFLYDAVAVGQPRRLEIFVRAQAGGKEGSGSEGKEVGGWGRTRGWVEVGFDAGGVLAASHYIFSFIEKRSHFAAMQERDGPRQTTVFRIPKSGLQVAAFYNPYRQVAACAVPDIANLLKVQEGKISWAKVLESQPQLKIVPGIEKLDSREYPVVGLGGREWVLVDVSEAEDVVKSVEGNVIDIEGRRAGVVWFVRKKAESGKGGEPVIEAVTCRVTGSGWEEEGSANAAAAVAAWLSMEGDDDLIGKVEGLKVEDSEGQEKRERRVFGVQTGVEVGRPGTIAVEVDLKVGKEGKRRIESIIVSGRANFTTKGELIGT